MDKIQKYEKVVINLSWVFIVLFLVNIFIGVQININATVEVRKIVSFVLLLSTLNIIRSIIIKYSNRYYEKTFLLYRGVEILLFLFIDSSSLYGMLPFMLLLFAFVLTSISRGRRISYLLLTACLFLDICNNVFRLTFVDSGLSITQHLFYHVTLYVILITIIELCIVIFRETKKNEDEKSRLIIEVKDKYDQLAVAQNEIKNQYDKLKESNFKLEDTNQRLSSSIAEFYTLQQISEAISSIFDISELLKFVNDVIIGVMGVNYSTIVLFDSKKNKLKVQFTNITNKEELAILNDNINCSSLADVLKNERSIIENRADDYTYEFIQNREIGSFICIPLSSKSRKFGLALIEHKNSNTFDDENLRLLTTIGKQVSIAIENAELYANLQELATVDGLTGVYNRMYFHERFEKEFKMAQDARYNLSVVIFDIDLFKRFNDTYGHQFGDVVLKSVAQIVKANLRVTDTIARFGGEEFVIILPHTSMLEAFEKVEKLRLKVENNVVKDNLITASVTASFGIASFPETSFSEIELVRHADNALYSAKGDGRNCVRAAKEAEEQVI